MIYYIIKLIGSIPFRILYGLSDVLFVPFYYLVRYRRHIVRKNLTESFPNKSQREIVEIEKRFYHSFLDVALETCKLLTLSKEEMMRRMRFVNVEAVNEFSVQQAQKKYEESLIAEEAEKHKKELQEKCRHNGK